jgi:hypothetical protein
MGFRPWVIYKKHTSIRKYKYIKVKRTDGLIIQKGHQSFIDEKRSKLRYYKKLDIFAVFIV